MLIMDKYTTLQYYTPFIVLVWLTLLLLCVLVFENNRLKKEEKTVLYVTYILVAIAAASEWFGLLFNGNTDIPSWLLKFIKFVDYVLTPAAGGAIVLQFKKKTKIFQYIIFGLLAVNFIFQFICLFTDWMLVINEHNVYSHGILYNVYVVIYFLILILAIVEFALYGRRFRRHNIISLYSILVFLVTGVVLQMILDIKTAYLAITIALALLFIHYSEFSQLAADDKIQEQKILITIDPLTGILNRYAYEKALSRVDDKEDFVVFSIDINGLKRANDSKGHQAGDELICGAAQVISEVFNQYGKCYRTGGDEFIALSNVDPDRIDAILEELDKKVKAWKGQEIEEMSLSAGAASRKEFPDATIDELVATADQRMYKIKSEYYISHGIDRRRR